MKSILVKDVHGRHGTAYAVFPADAALQDIIVRFSTEPGLRAVFLVDPEERFAGLLTRRDLLLWVTLHAFGGSGLRDVSAGEVRRLVFASKASDLARGDRLSIGVRESDTLQTALEQMVRSEQDVIPVLDDDGKIVGDIRLSEVLQRALAIASGE